jgi:putative SOS response-associated peptidase YedK
MNSPGNGRPKKWCFTKVGEDWFCIAGVWRPIDGGEFAFTMLTCQPGPDVAPIHNRQVVILEREQWSSWLDPAHPEKDLLQPSSKGTLSVERLR